MQVAQEGRRALSTSVILTKVRIQGPERCPTWLWILTFVRMTEWVGYRSAAVRHRIEGGMGRLPMPKHSRGSSTVSGQPPPLPVILTKVRIRGPGR